MNDIQKARDVLAKYGKREWAVSYDEDFDRWDVVEVARRFEGGYVHGRDIADFDREEDAQRVGLTAGNSELLDAIDELLACAEQYTDNLEFNAHATGIAIAILSADERMQQ